MNGVTSREGLVYMLVYKIKHLVVEVSAVQNVKAFIS